MSDTADATPVTSGTGDRLLEHPAVARVRAALTAAGLRADVVVLDEHARTAAAAAEQLGVGVAQIANSLVFAVPPPAAENAENRGGDTEDDDTEDDDTGGGADGRRAVLVMTSGAHRVDVTSVAALLGVERLDRADPDFVRRTTGFAIGGVAPVGHPAPLQTLVDVTLARHDEIWAAAGHPRTVFRTTYDQLLLLTGGQAAEVA